MKNILFYGDSNTWGFDPATGLRYPYEKRWTSICAKKLGGDYHCIASGMNGRMTVFDDPVKACRNGFTAVDYVLQTHKPLDLAVIMLGTNDLKFTDAAGSAEGLKKVLVRFFTANERYALSSPVFLKGAKILVISPVNITNPDWFAGPADAVAESMKFDSLFRACAEAALKEALEFKKRWLENRAEGAGCETEPSGDGETDIRALIPELWYMNAAEVTGPSEKDGVHLGPEGHEALGKAAAEKIREIL